MILSNSIRSNFLAYSISLSLSLSPSLSFSLSLSLSALPFILIHLLWGQPVSRMVDFDQTLRIFPPFLNLQILLLYQMCILCTLTGTHYTRALSYTHKYTHTLNQYFKMTNISKYASIIKRWAFLTLSGLNNQKKIWDISFIFSDFSQNIVRHLLLQNQGHWLYLGLFRAILSLKNQPSNFSTGWDIQKGTM